MKEVGIATLIILIANVFCSLQGLNDRSSFKRNNFEIDTILFQKDYRRLITAGFFHASSVQLLLNMITLCFFIGSLGYHLGEGGCMLVFFAGLLGGNLFALFIYRNEEEYAAAAGASGAVTAIVFATLAVLPGFWISFFGKHFHITGWLYACLYILFSIYGIKSKKDNIGHEVQLAGGLAGLAIAILLKPAALHDNLITIVSVGITAVVLIFVIINNPRILFVHNKFFEEGKQQYTIENILGLQEADNEHEINAILEKIHQDGIASLSTAEKEKLNRYSRIIQ